MSFLSQHPIIAVLTVAAVMLLYVSNSSPGSVFEVASSANRGTNDTAVYRGLQVNSAGGHQGAGVQPLSSALKLTVALEGTPRAHRWNAVQLGWPTSVTRDADVLLYHCFSRGLPDCLPLLVRSQLYLWS